MFRIGHRRRRVALFAALLGLALQALWPLLAQARPAYVGLPQTTCTEHGQAGALRGDGAGAPAGTVGCKHCCLCMIGGDRTHAAPPSLALAPAESSPVTERPVAAPAAAFHSRPVSTARPRAPPFPL